VLISTACGTIWPLSIRSADSPSNRNQFSSRLTLGESFTRRQMSPPRFPIGRQRDQTRQNDRQYVPIYLPTGATGWRTKVLFPRMC
jgi:hypothetical protein